MTKRLRERDHTLAHQSRDFRDGVTTTVKHHKRSLPLEPYRPQYSFIQACHDIVQIIRELLKQSFGVKWSVIPQGSFVQGLQLLGSDLDLVLLDGTDSWRNLNRRRNADELERVVRRLTRVQWEESSSPLRVSVVQKIYSARVPLVKLRVTVRDLGQQVMVDMCYGDPSRGLCDEFVARAINKVDSSITCQNFILSLKVWANKRGICETMSGGISCFAVVLLALYHFQLHKVDWEAFFVFFQSLRSKPSLTVCVEKLKLVPRPFGEHDFLHVSVPCRRDENAARCTRIKVWNDKISPEIHRAISIIRNNNLHACTDFDRVVSCLLDPKVTLSNANMQGFEFPDSEGDSGNEGTYDGSSDIEIVGINQVEPAVPESEESDGSDICEVIAEPDMGRRPPGQTPDLSTVIECEECPYFSFNQTAMNQHMDRMHTKKNKSR